MSLYDLKLTNIFKPAPFLGGFVSQFTTNFTPAITFFILLFTSLVSTASEKNCFINFDKTVCGGFLVLDRVIFKSKLSKQTLIKKLKQPIRQLAFLNSGGLYLIDSDRPVQLSLSLSKKEYIEYAQPDISQTRTKHQLVHASHLTRYGVHDYWKTTKGKGVNIAIIDDGINLTHEDLQGVKHVFSYDVDYKTLSSDPKTKLDTHGTLVAGVIFAQHNKIGINGIAPDAGLIAIRQTTNITSDTILAFTVAKKAGAHIINCSWNSPLLLEPVYDIIKFLSKDTAIVFSAGNDGKRITPFSSEASIPEVLTVGIHKKYSNHGELVDFYTEKGLTSTSRKGTYQRFGGTSSAAPIISGLLALELSKNNLDLERSIRNLRTQFEQPPIKKNK